MDGEKIFSDDDLKRLKDDIEGREKEDLVLDAGQAKALLVRLEAAEYLIKTLQTPKWGELEVFKVWRKAAGK